MWVVWEEWNPCSATCGNGVRTRRRGCKGGRPGDRGCESGGDFDEGECRAEIECPRYEHWLTWEKCSASCLGGTRKRERSCLKFAEWQKCVPEVNFNIFNDSLVMTHLRTLKSLQDQAISLSSILLNTKSVAWDRVHTGGTGVNGILALSHVVEVLKNEPEVVKME